MTTNICDDNDIKLSRIVAGVMNWGIWGSNLSASQMSKLISQCVENEITSFDHADIYGGHTTEDAFGNAFKLCNISRDKIQLVTKCGIMMPSPGRPSIREKHYNVSKEHIIQSVETSLSNLGTDFIDLLLIHRPSPLMAPAVIASAFEDLRKSGKVLSFGVSNFTPAQFDMIASVTPLLTNQVEASLLHLDPFTDGTFYHSLEKGYHPMVWSPLGGGRLFNKSAEYDLVHKKMRLMALSKQLGFDLDLMSYLFLLNHPADLIPVTGSSNINRILVAKKAEEMDISDAVWFKIWTAATGKEVA